MIKNIAIQKIVQSHSIMEHARNVHIPESERQMEKAVSVLKAFSNKALIGYACHVILRKVVQNALMKVACDATSIII